MLPKTQKLHRLITLDGDNAGINGIRIRYPENTPYEEDRTTTYAVRGNGKGVYAVNCSLASADLGFDFTGCDDFFIKKVSTCCYTNSYLLGGKGGTLTGCLQNGTVIQRCGAPEQTNTISGDDLFPILFDRILRRYGAYITIDGGEDITISNTFCYGIAKFLYCKSGSGIVGVNLGADNIGMKYALVMLDEGDMTVINLMRYNGKSIKHEGGHLKLYNQNHNKQQIGSNLRRSKIKKSTAEVLVKQQQYLSGIFSSYRGFQTRF